MVVCREENPRYPTSENRATEQLFKAIGFLSALLASNCAIALMTRSPLRSVRTTIRSGLTGRSAGVACRATPLRKVHSDHCFRAYHRPMELPLSPLEFARRARNLYAGREALIDGSVRLTYEQFFSRCDRWSSALAHLGVRNGDRVATIAHTTNAQLESFYAFS